jgi:diguanylate cyclase (GGDEF)-like protein/PAS domain S-box-containing protein
VTTPQAQGVLLVVEDDPDHAFLVRRQLRDRLQADLDIVPLGSAAEAVSRLGQGDVRCIVLDLSLPDAKGLEAVTMLRGVAPDVPIVVLTGLDNDEVGRQAVELGAQDFLVKGQHGSDALVRSVVFALERAKRRAAEQDQARTAGRLGLVLEASAEGICLVDAFGVLSFVNRAAAELLGAPAADLTGAQLHDFHRCEQTPCRLLDDLCSPVERDAGEHVFLARDGRRVVLEVRTRPLKELSDGGGAVVNLTDLTERRQVQDALAEREGQLVEAQRLARLGSWEWDLVTDEVVWSGEMFRVTGLRPEQVPSDGRAVTAYTDLVPEAERSELRVLFETRTTGRPPVVVVHRIVRPDGQTRWVQCRATVIETYVPAIGDTPLRIVGTVQDITEQKVAEDALAHQALHDALTGLPNRALLLDRLDRALADPRRAAVAVVFMDLDRFKWVNDSISHAAGDELLVAVSARIGSVTRASDTVARFGGDEFVVVCDQLTSERQLFEVVERLSGELTKPFVLEGHEVIVTASLGLAVAPVGEDVESEALIRDADTAMYRAKEKGRARVEIFDEAMRERASERIEVQGDLRLGLHHGQLKPWFQPVVDVRTGRVVGCEALARWLHPTKGLLMPEAFIALAEESGAIVPLGASLLLEACRQVATWNRSRPVSEPLSVAVNVSARQLSSPQLVDTVRDALAITGLPGRLLCLEVTESVVMEDVVMSGAVLGRLRELGVRTAVDDFGTGYSSLAYLLSLPVDLLKIDRSFIRALDTDGGPAVAIVRAIAALADALGLGVLAEGVETVDQLAQVDGLGVQHAQGYLWGKAVPAAEATWARGWSAPATLQIPRARSSEQPTEVRA